MQSQKIGSIEFVAFCKEDKAIPDCTTLRRIIKVALRQLLE